MRFHFEDAPEVYEELYNPTGSLRQILSDRCHHPVRCIGDEENLLNCRLSMRPGPPLPMLPYSKEDLAEIQPLTVRWPLDQVNKYVASNAPFQFNTNVIKIPRRRTILFALFAGTEGGL